MDNKGNFNNCKKKQKTPPISIRCRASGVQMRSVTNVTVIDIPGKRTLRALTRPAKLPPGNNTHTRILLTPRVPKGKNGKFAWTIRSEHSGQRVTEQGCEE